MSGMRVYVGIDLGSTTTKAVALDRTFLQGLARQASVPEIVLDNEYLHRGSRPVHFCDHVSPFF